MSTYMGLAVPLYPDGTTTFEAQSDDLLLEFGKSAATQLSFDLKWFANEASGASYLYFDASANNIYTTGVDFQFKDNDYLTFGTGAGAAGDVQIAWDATNLNIIPAADNTVVIFGSASLNTDVKFLSSAASTYLLWDPSANQLITSGKVDAKFVASAASTYIQWDASANSLLTSGKVTAKFTGSSAGGYLTWVPAKNQLLLRASSKNDRALLNLGAYASAPDTGVDQGDLFVKKDGSNVFRMGVVTTGTTILYMPKFQYTAGSSS